MSADALVVFSGGQDSTTCLYWAKEKWDHVEAITFNYGQRSCWLEIEAASEIAANACVTHEIVDIPDCLVSSSPLTSDTQLEAYDSFEEMEDTIGTRREMTFVPMRNALFLTLAANRAEAKGISNIVTGVCQMDNANYDDCRKTFLTATEQYINTALGHDHRGTQWISIHAPLLYMSKAQSIYLAQSIPGAFDALGNSVSCYEGFFPPCGKCHACVLRAEGFKQADVPDPLLQNV